MLLLSEDDRVAEIGELDLTVGLDEDVVRFDVAVDDILSVKVEKAFERLVDTVLAELFRVLALKLLEHGGEGTAVHQLHEDPQPILEVKRLVALHNRFA